MTSLILGISGATGSFCCAFFAIPLGLAAVITGIVGLSQLKAAPAQHGRGHAIAGLCCGAVSLVLPIALIALQITTYSFSTS